MIKKIFSVALSIVYPLLLVIVIGMTIATPRHGTISFREDPLATLPAYTVDLDKHTITPSFGTTCHYTWYQIGPYYRAEFTPTYLMSQSPKVVFEQWSHKQAPSNYTSTSDWRDDYPTWAHMAEQLTYCRTQLVPARGLYHPIMPALVWSLCGLSLLLSVWMVIHPKSAVAGLLWYRNPDHPSEASSKILPYLFRCAGVVLLICALLLLHFLIFIFV